MKEYYMCKYICLVALAWTAVQAIAEPPSINGFLDDTFWTTQARVWRLSDPDLDAQARCLLGWDERYLYLAAEVRDPQVIGQHRGRKVPVWLDDAVELFLDFGGGDAEDRTPQTFEYGFSAGGGVNWTRGVGNGDGNRFPGHDYPPQWDSQVNWATRLMVGEYTAAGVEQSGYVIEARIPWTEFPVKPPFKADQTIGILWMVVCRPGPEQGPPPALVSVPGIDFSNNHKPRLWQRMRIDWPGPLPIRGRYEELPAPIDSWTDPAGPRLNRALWQSKLQRMKDGQLNTLVLHHPRFWSALVTDDDQRRIHREHLQWLIETAREAGIDLYLSFDCPTTDTNDGRQQLRQAIGTLWANFPQLAGLAVCTQPSAAGQADMIVDTVIAGLKEIERNQSGEPRLILDTIGLSPQEAIRIVQSWPRTIVLHHLQGGQWFLPRIDPVIANDLDAMRAAGADLKGMTEHIVIGGPQGASQYLYWGDPQWMRDLCQDLRHQGLDGMLLLDRSADPWLTETSFAYYTEHVRETYVPRYWEEQLHLRYGCGRQAEHLLAAVREASAIMPELTTFMHSQDRRFMPQFGLPLAFCLAMPTLSTYESPYNNIDYDWGVRLDPLGFETDRTALLDTADARRIATAIHQHAELAESRLTNLKSLKSLTPEQGQALHHLSALLELNIACGKHYAHRLEAAIAWKEFKSGRGRGNTFLTLLLDSVKDWQRIAEAAGKVYPDPLPYWQAQMVSVPPWSAQELDNSYRAVVGHWRDQIAVLDREFRLMQMKIDQGDLQANLPMWDRLTALPSEALITRLKFDFESPQDLRVKLHEGTKIIGKPNALFSGRMALLADSGDWGDGRHLLFETVPTQAPIPSHVPLQISIAYAVLECDQPGPYEFEIGLSRADGSELIGDHRRWSAPADYLGRRVLHIDPLDHDDYKFYVKIKGAARIAVDDLRISIIK